MSKILQVSAPLHDFTITIRGQLQAPDATTAKAVVMQQLSMSIALSQTIQTIEIDATPATIQKVAPNGG